MRLVVTVKQVPDPDISPASFKVDEAAKMIVDPAGVARVMNGYDANALEEALLLKAKHGGTVTAVSFGPERARDVLKYALAMGADAAVHVNDPSPADPDGSLTARALAAAIRRIGSYDLVLCGRQASDTDGGQVHLGIAQLLGLPAVSPVRSIEQVEEGSLVVRRGTEDGYQRLRVRLPALLGVSSEINVARTPPVVRLLAARRTEVPAWTVADIGLESAEPKVRLRRLYVEAHESRVQLVDAGSPEASGAKLAETLREARLV